MKKLFLVLLLLMPTVVSSEMATPDTRLDTYITLLRSDLKAQRAAVIVNNMHFSDAETEALWPIYNKYQKELSKVGDEKVALIKD